MEENKCPQCGGKMKKDAKFCIFCGYINYDAPGNEDFRNLVVEKKVYKQVEKERKRKEKAALKGKNDGKMLDYSLRNYSADNLPRASFREIIYRFFQRVWKFILTLLIIGGLVFLYVYIVRKQAVYVSDARSIVKEIKSNYELNDFSNCDGSGRYYFTFGIEGELNTYYGVDLKSPYNGSSYIGYVEAIKRDNGYDYFITISDGTFGIRKKNIDEIKNSDVLPYSIIDYNDVGDRCR